MKTKGLEAVSDLRFNISYSQDMKYKENNDLCDIIEKELKGDVEIMENKVFEALERMTEHLDLDDEYFYKQEKEDEKIIKQALTTKSKKEQAFDKVIAILGVDVALRFPDNQPMIAVFDNEGIPVVEKPIDKETYDLILKNQKYSRSEREKFIKEVLSNE